VWWSTDNSTIPGHNDIWVTTVNMSTNTSSTPLMIGEGVRPTIACDPRYVGTAQYDVAYLSAQNIGNIDNNWWGLHVIPGTSYCSPSLEQWNSDKTDELDGNNIRFSPAPANVLGVASTFGTIYCSGGTGEIVSPIKQIKSLAIDSVSTCGDLYEKGYEYTKNQLFQKSYDTLKKFIESCPLWPNSCLAFNSMTAAVQGLQKDTSIWSRYRNWLESVLYLNRIDPEYFCICVENIGGTLWTKDTTEQQVWQGTNRQLAVVKWLLDHTTCDTGMLRRDYTQARKGQYETWLNDTTIKLDTTLPSMHDLGLDSILNLHFSGVGPQPTLYARVLSSMTVSENPLRKTTLLRFDLDRAVYLKVDVLDELGRTVLGDESGHSYNPGRHELALDLSGQASGAYYLRISLGDGEVRTLKLIKKE
jgi:hypothetical protein